LLFLIKIFSLELVVFLSELIKLIPVPFNLFVYRLVSFLGFHQSLLLKPDSIFVFFNPENSSMYFKILVLELSLIISFELVKLFSHIFFKLQFYV